MPIDSAEKTAEAHAERALKSRTKRAPGKTGRTRKPRIPKLHRPKRESTKTIVARLYRTWSTIVHARTDGRCEVCGAEGKNDAHHVQPRQVCSGLRFDPRNGVCLCPSHHKFGRQSAHKGMLWFADWFRKNRPGDYDYVMANLDLELDCRDRSRLYAVEGDLHDRYGDAVEPLPAYDVVAYDRKGNKVQSVVQAHNNRAAEFVFWSNWPKTEIPLKGIHRTTEVKTKDLLRRTAEHLKEIKIGCYKPVSEMNEPEFVEYLNETFKGSRMDKGTMDRMTCMFHEYCASHGMDPRLFAIHGDRHGTVRIAPAVRPEKAAEMKRDLIGRGLMDEDGNEVCRRQLPKSTDAAAIAVVQECDVKNAENKQ